MPSCVPSVFSLQLPPPRASTTLLELSNWDKDLLPDPPAAPLSLSPLIFLQMPPGRCRHHGKGKATSFYGVP